jgi:pyridoxal phosphate enzyme (YggS family)
MDAGSRIKTRLHTVQDRIKQAAVSCGRSPGTVQLVAVSKTIGSEKVKQAVDAGATILGENYIQEARDKIAGLSGVPASWHFIGHLQRNKAKYAVKLFDLIHSVDTARLARELNKQAEKINKRQKILIQLNISNEKTKSGASADEAASLVKQMIDMPHISIQGFMTMPPFFDNPEGARPYFRALREIRDEIVRLKISADPMAELSMGMTGDFEVAIEEGATLVRIGTAIFGERS